MIPQTVDLRRLAVFQQMLAEPDPADLPPRRAHLHYDGDPNRRATVLPRLIMSWVQQRHMDVDGDV